MTIDELVTLLRETDPGPSPTMTDTWVDLTAAWPEIAAVAQAREKLLPSTRILIADYELLGVVGEYVMGHWLELSPDLKAYAGGDCGVDFPLVDVKATAGGQRLLPDPHLIVDEHKLDAGADYFCLVYVQYDRRRGRVVGHATPDELRSHRCDFGNGPTYARLGSELPSRGVPLAALAAAAQVRSEQGLPPWRVP